MNLQRFRIVIRENCRQVLSEMPSGELLFHGSSTKIDQFRKGTIFLSNTREGAWDYAKKDVPEFDGSGSSYIYTVLANKEKTYDATEVVESYIFDQPHDLIDSFRKDLDRWIEEDFAPKLRRKGYRYFRYPHPSPGGEIIVYVSLYPRKDLTIFDEDKIE